MSYDSADIFRCRNVGHKFRIIGSDKTPMKKSLQCLDCTLASGNPTFVAYGVDTLGFGEWRQVRKEADEPEVGR